MQQHQNTDAVTPQTTENTAPQGTATTKVSRPVQTVRAGAIGASIWQNENDKIGITLSRSWKSQDGDTGHSKTFYAGNRGDLHNVIDQACNVAEALERAIVQRTAHLSSVVESENETGDTA